VYKTQCSVKEGRTWETDGMKANGGFQRRLGAEVASFPGVEGVFFSVGYGVGQPIVNEVKTLPASGAGRITGPSWPPNGAGKVDAAPIRANSPARPGAPARARCDTPGQRPMGGNDRPA